jgi:hypothetical protein
MGREEITKGSSNIPGRIHRRSWVIGSGLFDVANRSLQQSLGKSISLSLVLSNYLVLMG